MEYQHISISVNSKDAPPSSCAGIWRKQSGTAETITDKFCKQVSLTSLKRSAKHCKHVGVSKNNGTPKSSILIFIINHPFWGTPIFGNIHVDLQAATLPMFLRLKPFSPGSEDQFEDHQTRGNCVQNSTQAQIGSLELRTVEENLH